ncbi:sigma-70 family RNA polymerase sigma factor [Gemmata algarum]|nr:sigma-70 family RNA polymerase sigma factor [Gemmata algarum]
MRTDAPVRVCPRSGHNMAVERLTETAEAADDMLSDRELLRRFRAGHESAFAALLRRHGTMVLRVCRRVLERPEDAEDAFQATFLVLARKAGEVAWHESIGTWLHSAAHRLSCEARRAAVRRHTRESRRTFPAPPIEGDALAEVSSRELLAILDEELAALPEENRGPLILCCMEGMSGDEAARHLGCSESTLKRRLRHARELLQERLSRRGIALPAAGFLALLAAGTAAAGLPPGLTAATTQAALAVSAGTALIPGVVSARALELTRHLLPAVSAKVKLAAGLLVMSGLAAVIALAGWDRSRPHPEPPLPPPVVTTGALPAPGVGVTVETTLRTRGDSIRQFAFDGKPDTFFASVENAGAADHFTLVFDRPVAVKSVEAHTGSPNEPDRLMSGWLDVSPDGSAFEPLTAFVNGVARGDAKGRHVRAVRIRPGTQPHRLLVREVQIQSEPPLAIFRHPVEFAVDASHALEMTEWAARAARVCERAYPMVCDELAADGFRPPHRVPLLVRRDARALSAASAGRVIVSAGYFEANPGDVGALIHSTSLVVQDYRARAVPTWLVQGIADYVRFFKFEPGVLAPLDPDIARHDGDSQQTAAFLAYLVATYDPALVRRLNAALRDGHYTDAMWAELTGKPLSELSDDWRGTLRR